jgi:hypothetical protein
MDGQEEDEMNVHPGNFGHADQESGDSKASSPLFQNESDFESQRE